MNTIKKIIEHLKYLYRRWVAKMPTFFRHVFWICTTLSLAEGAVAAALQNQLFLQTAPAWLISFLNTAFWVTSTAAIISKFAVRDPALLNPNQSGNENTV